MTEVFPQSLENPPSIREQTPWNVDFFSFGKWERDGINYFNPGLVRRPDGLWLIARRSVVSPKIRVGVNDLVAFKLSGKTPVLGQEIKMRAVFPKMEHFEDPRGIYYNGVTYISCCNFIIRNTNWTGAHQVVGSVGDDWRCINRYDPVYGSNGREIGMNTGNEKNWIWFFHNDSPHLIYMTSPHTVVRFDRQFRAQQSYDTQWDSRLWKYGHPRGGTPPVLIGSEYWSFFHSSRPWRGASRQYFMAAYSFEASYPFRITRISKAPILAGSIKDPWGPKKPLVVFPCGSDFNDGKWLVSLGVNDLESAHIEIPHDELESTMTEVCPKYSPKSLLKTWVTPRLKLDDVTLVCVDDRRPELASVAIEECEKNVRFGDIKFFTNSDSYKHAVKIPKLESMEGYCRFLVKDLHKHIRTSHCLIIQWDGYVVNPDSWQDEFLSYDYIGALWKEDGKVGNGGFSLRSKKLLQLLSEDYFQGPFLPEDCYICRTKRDDLEQRGIRIAPTTVASSFSVEGAIHHDQFGFHSFLTKLPDGVRRPLVFHHTGDLGDIIYSLPVIQKLGGGVLFISPSGHPKMPVRVSPTKEHVDNLKPLLMQQDYIWQCDFNGTIPDSMDYNLNDFRNLYVNNERLPNESLFQMNGRTFGLGLDESKPWLSVPDSITIQPIVVSRSQRYHNDLFPWKSLVSKHGNKMVFVGTPEEHQAFRSECGPVEYLPTSDLLELAKVINGADLCIMNQSAPCAIALGLGKRLVQESWGPDPNCRLRRKNAVYCTDGNPLIPRDWL
jgi:predicted GH43/DUF377 family glycosyl hydrolase